MFFEALSTRKLDDNLATPDYVLGQIVSITF